MKITSEMEAMYAKLVSLAPCAIKRNQAKNYLGLMVAGESKRDRIAVGIRQKDTSFTTRDEALIETLRRDGIGSFPEPSDIPKLRLRHIFPGLTVEMVAKHEEAFRKLVADSVRLKGDGAK